MHSGMTTLEQSSPPRVQHYLFQTSSPDAVSFAFRIYFTTCFETKIIRPLMVQYIQAMVFSTLNSIREGLPVFQKECKEISFLKQSKLGIGVQTLWAHLQSLHFAKKMKSPGASKSEKQPKDVCKRKRKKKRGKRKPPSISPTGLSHCGSATLIANPGILVSRMSPVHGPVLQD